MRVGHAVHDSVVFCRVEAAHHGSAYGLALGIVLVGGPEHGPASGIAQFVSRDEDAHVLVAAQLAPARVSCSLEYFGFVHRGVGAGLIGEVAVILRAF